MERSNGAWGNGTSWVAPTAGHSCPGHGRVQGVVKGRDRHRVTSEAALLMGLSEPACPESSPQPALVEVPVAAAPAHSGLSQRLLSPQTAAAAWGGDGWEKPAQPLTPLQCRAGEGSLGSRLLGDVCVCAHHGTHELCWLLPRPGGQQHTFLSSSCTPCALHMLGQGCFCTGMFNL